MFIPMGGPKAHQALRWTPGYCPERRVGHLFPLQEHTNGLQKDLDIGQERVVVEVQQSYSESCIKVAFVACSLLGAPGPLIRRLSELK